MVVFTLTDGRLRRNCARFPTPQPRFRSFGEPTIKGRYPFQAIVRTQFPSGISNCGGTLISNRYILTAAHCVEYFINDEAAEVTLGEYIRGKPEGSERKYRSSKIIVHPEWGYGCTSRYRQCHGQDIALIRLNSRVRMTKYIKPACLPKRLKDSKPKTLVTYSGWGRTWNGRKPTRPITAHLAITTRKSCQNAWGNIEEITERMICTKSSVGHKYGICKGDSGGM